MSLKDLCAALENAKKEFLTQFEKRDSPVMLSHMRRRVRQDLDEKKSRPALL